MSRQTAAGDRSSRPPRDGYRSQQCEGTSTNGAVLVQSATVVHDKTPETCGAAQSADDASGCESSRPPYALRHEYISQRLQEGLPAHVLSDRCDVSEEIIEKHYDERDETEKRELRQQVLEEFQEERDGGYL